MLFVVHAHWGQTRARSACAPPQPPGPTSARRRATAPLRAIGERDDVGLHELVRGVRRRARHHVALVETSHCAIRVVSPRREDDGALAVRGLVLSALRVRPVRGDEGAGPVVPEGERERRRHRLVMQDAAKAGAAGRPTRR